MNDDLVDFGYQKVARSDKQQRVGAVFASVARRYDLMNDLMSFGIHRLWKRYLIGTTALPPDPQILDLAGGTGDLAALLRPRLGARGRIVLGDINRPMLEVGRDRLLDSNGADAIQPLQLNAEALPFAERSFDLVTMAFGLRNVTDQPAALREIKRVLKRGGRALVLEFSRVQHDWLGPLYDFHSFAVLPRLGAAVAGDAASYRYLAESIRRHPDQQTLAAMMRSAGLERVEVRNLSGGIVAIHSGYRFD